MKRVLLMTVAGVLMASSAMAGMENARFALHAKASPTAKSNPRCDNAGTPIEEPNESPNYANLECTGYNTQFAANAYSDVYIVVGRAGTEGVAGVSFGLDYTFDAINPAFLVLTLCANGLYFPNGPVPGGPEFPADRGGARITWVLPEGCQSKVIGGTGVHAVVGVLNIYGYNGNVMSLTPNNNLSSGIPELAITSCGGATTELTTVWPPQVLPQILGKVGFGTGVGYNPCIVIPVMPTTWGKIKAQYTTN
jgi:hypothetical protein